VAGWGKRLSNSRETFLVRECSTPPNAKLFKGGKKTGEIEKKSKS